jgi:hypothetical protein
VYNTIGTGNKLQSMHQKLPVKESSRYPGLWANDADAAGCPTSTVLAGDVAGAHHQLIRALTPNGIDGVARRDPLAQTADQPWLPRTANRSRAVWGGCEDAPLLPRFKRVKNEFRLNTSLKVYSWEEYKINGSPAICLRFPPWLQTMRS